LVNLLAWQLENWSRPARTLQFASLSFDVAFQEIFSTWCSGGTLVLVDEEARRDPQAMLTLLGEQHVQRLFLPFVALQNLCEAAEYLGSSLPSLYEAITAGEQLKSTDAIRRFFARHPACTLVNQYGPTESHVVTAFTLQGRADGWPMLPPIGRPISGAKIYLLDSHRQLVPIGVPGELCIGGVSLARGYLNRPELADERFLPDPFSADPRARIYRTGDLARHLPDGNIAYLGRADHQVKIRGYRIEPGEIENVLRTHPEISEALIVAQSDHSGDKRLIAYLTTRGRTPSTTELREFLRRSLPDYMIPAAFVTLDAFPLSPNGKVDRAALPTPDTETQRADQYAPPTTDLERKLVEIWQRLLGLDHIGIDDNFFDLGGHSLLAVRLFSEIERLLGVRLPLVAIFRTGTILGLANELHGGGANVDRPTILKLRSEGSGTPLFCVGGVHVYQELADELAPDIPSYGIFLPSEQELFELQSGQKHTAVLSVPEMAAQYVRMVRQEQPQGPYMLLGLCFGGILAYEMACELVDQGEQVSMLVMLDALLSEAVRVPRRSPRRQIRRLRRTVSLAMPDRVNRLRGKAPIDETQRLAMARQRIYTHANRGYQPRPYSGQALLVRPLSALDSYRKNLIDETNGWGKYVAELEIHDVPGDHITHLRRPNVHHLSAGLRPRLERARAMQ
jgi:thioesterase domain-containing protein/acyl carrier protein